MTETRRLYYEDVYKKEFTATVVECREQKKGYAVILDESAFYPEGGGQPSDVGTLGDVKVTEVHEKDGELLHYTDKALEVGAKVEGKIDWVRRFDLMQQHSGEHMVSGIIHEKYGYDNVGFHMGSDVITVDLNGMLDDAQLAEIEREVNERVWEDKEVKITYPDAEELKTIDYRSKKELTGQVRIVTFPGVDVCACCGTHVTHTGEIGMVKLLSVVKFHDGIRMEMICGKRVLDYLNMVNEQNHQISMKLSATAFASFSMEVEPTMLMDPLKSASALFASVATSFVVSSAFASVVCSAVVAGAAVVAAAPEFPHPASIPAAITAEPIIAITFMPFFFIIIFSSTFVPLYVCIVLRYLYFSLLFSCSYIVEYTKVLQ